jgi:hypothetical protein
MMISVIIDKIEAELNDTFNTVCTWFGVDKELLYHKPANGGWSVAEILEHISLTNYFLLILIRKATDKALQKAVNNQLNLPSNYAIAWEALAAIGTHGAFNWNRPAHMEPTGTVDLNIIKSTLEHQLSECIECLKKLSNGEGTLYKTMMSVNGLGKIDVYHYILFVAQHSRRHLTQMENVRRGFETQN